ncbi:hypothetical protein FACS1894176_03230 [Bacteroidia bacterium]|nr:hypothetical protein FACS1894176_03230 [Bacteroidia bacterium]
MAGYYTDLLKGRSKELKITQKELAGKTGKERSYIIKNYTTIRFRRPVAAHNKEQ